MKSFKLYMNTNQAKEVLNRIFDETVRNISHIEMGELSKVFSFIVKDQPYIVHFRNNNESFIKANYMYRIYGGQIPIPAVVL